MKKITDIFTLVYKQTNCLEPKVFSYKSQDDALKAKEMVERNSGTVLYDANAKPIGVLIIEWCYVIDSKLIERI